MGEWGCCPLVLTPLVQILEAQRVIENAVKSLNDNLASVGGNRGPDAAYTHGEHKVRVV